MYPKSLPRHNRLPKNEEAIPVKAEPQTVAQQPATSAYLDSASYKITGTKTKYTIKEGETLTRVSLRFLWYKGNVAIHCETQSEGY